MAPPTVYILRFLYLIIASLVLVIGTNLMRLWKEVEERRSENAARRQKNAASRRRRRRRVRESDLREDQLCIVCRENPRELILLPCGHVCLCEDCSDNIHSDCPVCRAPIVQKHVAYVI